MAEVISPMFISSRLMAALKLDGVGTLHVGANHRGGDGRVVYQYVIENADGDVLAEGDDLRSGVGAEVDYAETMATLLAFLTAEAESYRYGMGDTPSDGWTFDADTAEWAYQNADELSIAEMDLEGE